jgi:DNA-binding winged helix-turn-helix (wHTH) protein
LLYRFEDCVLDTDRRELIRGAARVPVEPKVFDLIAFLVQHRERVVSQDDLLAGVWDGRIVSESAMRSRINAARAAIGDNGEEQRLIRTMPRKGFRFVGAVHEEHGAGRPIAAEEAGTAIAEASLAAPGAGMTCERVELAPTIVASGGLLPIESPGRRIASVAAAPPATRTRRAAIASSAVVLAAMLAATLAFLLWPKADAVQNVPAKSPAQVFDPAVVPLIRDDMRRSLAGYADRRDAKALAIGAGILGVADSAADAETAREEAMRLCSAKGNKCRVYAVGNEVVWSKGSLPMPNPRDIRTETLDIPLVPDDIPTLSDATKQTVARVFTARATHKAMAMITGGTTWASGAQSRSEAARLAVEWCGESRQRACLLISIDGLLTVQFPKSRPIARIFMPSTEVEIPAADRERIGQVYAGAEWRALARGGTGSWHPIAGASSEAAAIEGALAACAQADSDCRLYAIGNFRVSE